MAKKKRHHYIPRFYLKKFSINSEGKFLGLYNLNNRKFIQNAPLKSQAYENFLYGDDDEIENALAEMEAGVAQMFYYWTEKKLLYPPPLESNGFTLLRRFILYQASRTPKSGNDLTKRVNEISKAVVKEFSPDLWERLKDAAFVHKKSVLLTLINSVENEHVLGFLDCKFLVNLSLIPFVTSDGPVILYNQLLEQAKNYIGATGFTTKGLQIFYPIHPRLMICLYDSSVYDFGEGCKNCCSTESAEEVHQLNGLQLVNCNSQLFFDDLISEEYILELCNNFQDYRGTSKNITRFINQENRKFMLTSSENVQIGLELDFFRLKVNPNDFKNEISPIRHPSLTRKI